MSRWLKVAMGLKDLMETANPSISPPPATYNRGDDTKGPIDIALGCDHTAEALATAGFHSFYSNAITLRRPLLQPAFIASTAPTGLITGWANSVSTQIFC